MREGLRELAGGAQQPREWQPQILVFTESAERRARLLQFAAWISGGTGLVTAVQVVEDERGARAAQARGAEAEQALRSQIAELGVDAYPLVVAARELRDALATVLQSWGAGPIRSNLVVVNWLGEGSSESPSAALWYGRTLGQALRLGRSVVVFDADESSWSRLAELPNEKRRVDVWWFGGESSRLLLLLAYLTTRNESWDEAALRVLVPSRPDQQERTVASLERRLEEIRIDASVESVPDPDLEAVLERSGDAALVFLPLRLAGMRPEDPFGFGIGALLAGLPVVALVAAAEDVQITEEEAEPEPAEAKPAEA